MDDSELQDFDESFLDYYDSIDDELYKELEDMKNYGRFLYLCKACVGPTTSQTVELVGPLLALCFVLRVTSLLKLRHLVIHFVSFVCGLGALFLFVKKNSIYPLAMSVMGYGVLFVKNGRKGIVMGFTCVTFLVVWYVFAFNSQELNPLPKASVSSS